MTVVVATAGHVDHGKSTLIRALTGTDPDRLPEERRRQMTIDLGYAFLRQPDGSELDFIDAPGHEDYVGNMIVGAAAADAALLVVAADEGIRQQTEEHVRVLRALRVSPVVVAIAKVDRLTACAQDRRERLASLTTAITALVDEPARIVAVSALTGEGLAELVGALDVVNQQLLATTTPRPSGYARIAIDRTFVMRGRGLVVTGTLRGHLERGAVVRLAPGGLPARVRELQVHGEPFDRVSGGRVAANLVGVDGGAVRRGIILERGGAVEGADRLLACLDGDIGAWRSGGRQDGRLHLGSGQAMVSIRKLASATGGRVIASMSLDRPLATAPGDRFVLRRPSPAAVLGGGFVIALGAARFPRRISSTDAENLALDRDPHAHVAALVRMRGACPTSEMRRIIASHGLTTDALCATGDVMEIGEWCVSGDIFAAAAGAFGMAVAEHAAPDRSGLPVWQARSVIAQVVRRTTSLPKSQTQRIAIALLEPLLKVTESRTTHDGVVLPARLPEPPDKLREAIDQLTRLLDSRSPPSLEAAVQLAGTPKTAIDWLERAGRIRRFPGGLALTVLAHREMEAIACELATRGPVTPAALRNAAGTTRRFAVAVLEDLDRRGVLRRGPEGHVLVRQEAIQSRTQHVD